MSIKIRLALLLGVLLAAFLTVLQVLRQLERTQAEELTGQSLQADQLALERWIDLTNQPLQRFVQDCSRTEELAGFLATRDPAWADKNLGQNLASHEIHALWILDNRGQVVYAAGQDASSRLPPPGDAASPARLPGSHFFAESRDGLLEVWSEPVIPPRTNTPLGELVVTRRWHDKFLATIGRLAEMNLQLAPAGTAAAPDHTRAQLRLPLKGPDGSSVRELHARIPVPDFAQTLERDTLAVRLFVAFGILLILALWLGVRQWVLRPLDRITESLARGDATLIRPVKNEKSELARVAQLVESSFAQKAALEREIEEHRQAELALRESEKTVRHSLELRSRLARDLHDGVIQSIYAAGLGLESALSLLESDAPGARTRLQHCRQSLNNVIREVRGFVNGLEPEQMHFQGFAQELAALARTMQALWPVRISLQVDADIARQLTAGQEVHGLQIVRECISNALRHGQAKEVRITLESAAAGGMLTVRDDGRGFDPDKTAGEGHGLTNLAARAREMDGTLRLDSRPGKGSAVIITFPVNTSKA